MIQNLTIVGASVRAAAQSAVRAGLRVRAADLFADTDTRNIADTVRANRYPRDLGQIIRGDHPGGWMYTGALENYPAQLARWQRERPLLGNSAQVVRRVRDPSQVARALAAGGLACPAVENSGMPLASERRWLQKPLRSAGGSGIEFVRGASRTPGHYWQEFIAGQPWSAAFLAARGRAVLLGATEQLVGLSWTGASGFRYCGSIGPLDLPPRHFDELTLLGEVLAREFQLVGLFGVDGIGNDEGLWPVEINPRYTASMEVLERATGASMVALHLAACEAGDLPAVMPANAVDRAGKAICFSTRRVVVPPEGLPKGLVNPSSGCQLADIPAPNTTIEAGWPLVTVFAEARDSHAVGIELKRRMREVDTWTSTLETAAQK